MFFAILAVPKSVLEAYREAYWGPVGGVIEGLAGDVLEGRAAEGVPPAY